MSYKTPSAVSRRRFLSLAAAGIAWSQKPADETTSSKMIVRSKRPLDLEMPASGFGEFITPVESFFVRTHVIAPEVDVTRWRLEIGGHVAEPLTLTDADIRRMPSVEVIAVLECAGNGRSFYEPSVAGLQWTLGAVGNGRWRGVRLRELLQRAGIKDGAVEILFDGADIPIGTMPDFQRGIPLSKALHPETLLAYEMNGQALPRQHGFPLRLVVPGWAGNSWMKWVRRISVLSEKSSGFWMKSAYLKPDEAGAPGAAVSADLMTPVTSLRVKSAIAEPAAGSRLEPGRRTVIHGAAWTGDQGKVTGVDVSTDRGRTWKPARLTGPETAFGWRLWEFPWTPIGIGYHTVLARARDSRGDIQPTIQEWNPSGYLWNSVARVDVQVGAVSAVAATPLNAIPPAAEPPEFRNTCLSCHDDDVILQQRLTPAQWDRELTKMSNWGARVSPENRKSLLDYLSRIAGPVK